MNRSEALQVLGITSDADKKKIKAAYAALVKKYHPEEHPAEWNKIHDAYKTALGYAENNVSNSYYEINSKEVKCGENLKSDQEQIMGNLRDQKPQTQKPQTQKPQTQKPQTQKPQTQKLQTQKPQTQRLRTQKLQTQKPQTQKPHIQRLQTPKQQSDTEQQELNELFDDLENLSETVKREHKQQLQEQLSAAVNLLQAMRNKRKTGIEEWEIIFNKEEYAWAVRQDEFIMEWGRVLENKCINKEVYHYLKEQLQIIRQYNQNMQDVKNKTGIINGISYTDMKIDSAYYRGTEKKRNIVKKLLCIFLAAVILLGVIGAWNRNQNQVDQEPEQILSGLMAESLRASYEAELLSFYNRDEEYQKSKLADGLQVHKGIYLYDLNGASDETDRKYYFHEIPIEEAGKLEGITLTDQNALAFEITTDRIGRQMVLYFDRQMLGFSEDCSIYYGTDGIYTEVIKWDGQNIMSTADKRYWYLLLDYQAFIIYAKGEEEQTQYTIILAEK